MAFDARVSQSFVLTYDSNLQLALQQMGPKLRAYVTEKSVTGEAVAASDVIGTMEMEEIEHRVRSNADDKPQFTKRWLTFPNRFRVGGKFDTEDMMRAAMAPDAEVIRTAAASAGRKVDDIILGVNSAGVATDGGIMGQVVEGKRPGGAGVALPSSEITVHGSTGLTIAKLRGAIERLWLNENDLDRNMAVMAITPRQHDDLLGIVESASANLNMLEQPHIVDGRVRRLMGLNFIVTNRLPKTGSTRSCPVWTKDNIVLGIWQDIASKVWNDSSADEIPTWRVDLRMQATRIHDKGVHIIECTEA